ncbi:MAG: molybdopterin-dependent oxidoreductase [Burkholderiales bacterium]|nr:molybdopterin-dependent oxidoreductase [Burkholderiales bacterium]MBK8664382.1 molybdopterin-dependent oxidoreductase [Burkholderiales bacterium]
MNSKRQFLANSLAAGTAVTLSACASPAARGRGAAGPTLLTLTGTVRPNRGPLDKALDQMMAKQQIAFERAHALDFAALAALPARDMRPTLEYDARPHRLHGPLLTDVLAAVGAPLHDAALPLALRAIDGYTVPITVGEARRLGLIVATHLDGAPMPLGGLGPLWAVLDADRIPELAAKPLPERFAQCPWGLYHVAVGV